MQRRECEGPGFGVQSAKWLQGYPSRQTSKRLRRVGSRYGRASDLWVVAPPKSRWVGSDVRGETGTQQVNYPAQSTWCMHDPSAAGTWNGEFGIGDWREGQGQ